MNNRDAITLYNFIADYTDHTGQHFYQCFQMMDLLATDEARAANNLCEHLAIEGMTVYCLMCIREKLTAKELQHIADSGELPDLDCRHVCLYPSQHCIRDMKLSLNSVMKDYFIGPM